MNPANGMESRLKDDELRKLMATGPPAASLWSHVVTGGTYRVLSTALVEASKEVVVVYRSNASGVVFTRPIEEWSVRFQPMRRLDALEARGFRSKSRVLEDRRDREVERHSGRFSA